VAIINGVYFLSVFSLSLSLSLSFSLSLFFSFSLHPRFLSRVDFSAAGDHDRSGSRCSRLHLFRFSIRLLDPLGAQLARRRALGELSSSPLRSSTVDDHSALNAGRKALVSASFSGRSHTPID